MPNGRRCVNNFSRCCSQHADADLGTDTDANAVKNGNIIHMDTDKDTAIG